PRTGRGDDLVGLPAEAVEPRHGVVQLLEAAEGRVDVDRQIAAALETLDRELVGNGNPADRERLVGGGGFARREAAGAAAEGGGGGGAGRGFGPPPRTAADRERRDARG